MKILATSLAATLLASATLPALAGGPVMAVPEPAPIMVTPPIVMATGGDWTGLSAGVTLGYGNAAVPSGGGSGMIYGVRGAYDYDFGGWVVGGTASYDMTDFTYGGGANNVNAIGRVGVRGGVDLGRAMVYATGGAAWAMQTSAVGDSTEAGWFAGVGTEYQLNRNWTVGGEVLTSRFSDNLGTGDELNAVTLGINANYRF